jgi:hypothetical protein
MARGKVIREAPFKARVALEAVKGLKFRNEIVSVGPRREPTRPKAGRS